MSGIVRKLPYGKFLFDAKYNTIQVLQKRTQIQTDRTRTRQRIRKTFNIQLSLTESYYIPH